MITKQGSTILVKIGNGTVNIHIGSPYHAYERPDRLVFVNNEQRKGLFERLRTQIGGPDNVELRFVSKEGLIAVRQSLDEIGVALGMARTLRWDEDDKGKDSVLWTPPSILTRREK